jgi:hypothetical protein
MDGEKDGICGTREKRKTDMTLMGKPGGGRTHSEDLGMGGRMPLKWILQK